VKSKYTLVLFDMYIKQPLAAVTDPVIALVTDNPALVRVED
jgi:hypothetical protein